MKSSLFIIFSLQLAALGAAAPPSSPPKEFIWPAVLFATLDQNKDGFITQNEIKPLLPANPEELKKSRPTDSSVGAPAHP